MLKYKVQQLIQENILLAELMYYHNSTLSYMNNAISAKGDGSELNIPSSTMTNVKLTDTEMYDGYDVYDREYFTLLSDGGIEVLTSGLYLICGSVNIRSEASTSSRTFRYCYVRDSDGVQLASGGTTQSVSTNNNAYNSISTGAKVVYLQDSTVLYLTARVLNTTGTVYTADNGTYLSIVKLS